MSDAKQNGFDDVLWLLDDYVQEMTVLNTFFVLKNRYGKTILVTPPDNGCILPGNIRNSILQLTPQIEKDLDCKVIERPISIHEILSAAYEDRLIEACGASTPSFIQPISKICFRDACIQIPSSKESRHVKYLNKLITGIMEGPSEHEWVFPMCLDS